MVERRCETCDCWEPLDRPVGMCQRHAPRPVLGPQPGEDDPACNVWWPETMASERCGEWQPLPLVQVREPGLAEVVRLRGAEIERLAQRLSRAEARVNEVCAENDGLLAERDALRHEVARLQGIVDGLRSFGHELLAVRDQRDQLLADARAVGQVIGCDHPEDGHARCVRARIAELLAEKEV